MLVIASIVAAGVLVAGSAQARAQEPVAPPTELALIATESGHVLLWRDNSTDERGFAISVELRNDDGTEAGGGTIGLSAADETAYLLPERLPNAPQPGCYAATFVVYATRGNEIAVDPALLDAQYCLSVDGLVRYVPLSDYIPGSPNAPSDITIVPAYENNFLQWRDNSDDETGFTATMIVENPDGSEQGRYPLGRVPANTMALELPDGNSDLQDGRCYAVALVITAIPGSTGRSSFNFADEYTMCAGAGGSFLSFAAAGGRLTLPPPPPVANLRIFRDDDNYWNLTWDPSPGAVRYDAGIQVLDAEGMLLGQAAFPSVSGVTTVRIDRVVTDPFGLGCFTAIARVFAVGVDGSVTLPANVTTPVCIELYGLTFPDTGSGAAAPTGDHRLLLAIALAAAGFVSAACGYTVRRRMGPALHPVTDHQRPEVRDHHPPSWPNHRSPITSIRRRR